MTDLTKPDELIEYAKSIVASFEDELAEGRMQPTMLFDIDIDKRRLLLMPDFDGEQARNILAWQTGLLASAMDNLWALTWVCDSYTSSSLTKHDGTEWGPGGMQYAKRNNTIDADLVTDCLMVQTSTLDRTMMVHLAYHVDNGKLDVHWDDMKVFDDQAADNHVEGFFVDMMKGALERPKLMELMAEQGITRESVGVDLEQARMHTILAVMKAIMSQTPTNGMLVPTYSDEEQQILKESMAGHPDIRAYDQDDIAEISDLHERFRNS